ncbi:HD-GYP domain-containing protein [Sporohalobacter salinus]|uniref:HD-GYP domain-containing protein n=1 Tax=Sporohalobacter salinus TaxID=1494606 RepID=UPI00196206B9|nr:HD domain-containing phosphohydrolase [Sporohalobacter salinus]MBM7623425.1 HD-GYP domain-containing protein (c-di-GMP phosphodiesterase class II) [Sporohalobacter salinus]
MYLKRVKKLESGVELAKDIYTSEDKVLLKKGTELTEEYIGRLQKLGINYVYINDYNLNDVEIDNIVSENVKREAVLLAKECLESIKNKEEDQQRCNLIQAEKIINIIDDIIDDIVDAEDLVLNLKDIRKLEDELFFHLVNVAIFSLIVGNSLGYSREKLELLGVGSFLHDIGKARVPAKILNKPDKLTDDEYKEVQKHTVYGYEILWDHDKINELSSLIAYQHHERYDGSGYPEGIAGKTIHEFGRYSGHS